MPTHKLSEIAKGKSCRVLSFTDDQLKIKLLEMGCLPGEIVKVSRMAPFNGPIAIDLNDYTLSLRKNEAETIIVEPIEV